MLTRSAEIKYSWTRTRQYTRMTVTYEISELNKSHALTSLLNSSTGCYRTLQQNLSTANWLKVITVTIHEKKKQEKM